VTDATLFEETESFTKVGTVETEAVFVILYSCCWYYQKRKEKKKRVAKMASYVVLVDGSVVTIRVTMLLSVIVRRLEISPVPVLGVRHNGQLQLPETEKR